MSDSYREELNKYKYAKKAGGGFLPDNRFKTKKKQPNKPWVIEVKGWDWWKKSKYQWSVWKRYATKELAEKNLKKIDREGYFTKHAEFRIVKK